MWSVQSSIIYSIVYGNSNNNSNAAKDTENQQQAAMQDSEIAQ